jgi:hypothetical protein
VHLLYALFCRYFVATGAKLPGRFVTDYKPAISTLEIS